MEALGHDFAQKVDFNVRFFNPPLEDDRSAADGDHRFFNYPEHHGWEIKDGQAGPLNKPNQGDTVLPWTGEGHRFKLTQLLQGWLFFEALRAIFEIPGQDFDYYAFVSEDRRWITTERLSDHIVAWSDRVKRSKNKAADLICAQGILYCSWQIVSEFCSLKESLAPTSIWPVDEHVSLSLMILGEVMTRALIRIQRENNVILKNGWQNEVIRSQGWGLSSLVL